MGVNQTCLLDFCGSIEAEKRSCEQHIPLRTWTSECPNTGCFNIWLALKTARCALRESGLDETSVIVAGRRPVMLSKSPVLGGSFHLVSVLVSLVHPSGLKWIKVD